MAKYKSPICKGRQNQGCQKEGLLYQFYSQKYLNFGLSQQLGQNKIGKKKENTATMFRTDPVPSVYDADVLTTTPQIRITFRTIISVLYYCIQMQL